MIDLARAKQHLKIEADDSEEDALIAAYLTAAVGHVETATGHLLAPRQVTQRVASARVGGAIALFRSPVRDDAATVTVIGIDGTASPVTSFRLVEGVDGQLLPPLGEGWPPVIAGHPAALTVAYSAGYDPDDVPPVLDHAVLLVLGHLYRVRDEDAPMPRAIEALIAPYRPIGIA